jgi:hypothetical protein
MMMMMNLQRKHLGLDLWFSLMSRQERQHAKYLAVQRLPGKSVSQQVAWLGNQNLSRGSNVSAGVC